MTDAGEVVSGDANGCVAIWLAPDNAIPKMLDESTNTRGKVTCVDAIQNVLIFQARSCKSWKNM